MRAVERAVIHSAVVELMAEDGDFNGAIGKLCRLIGITYGAAKVLSGERLMSVKDMAALPNQSFSAKWPEGEK